MNRLVRFSSRQAALWSGVFLAGCAPQTDYSGITTSPVTMACDGGRTFTVAYADGFETAIIETDGKRLELPRVRTSLGMNPTPLSSATRRPSEPIFGTPLQESTQQQRPGGIDRAGTTGVRYGSDEALFISRNQQAVLEVGSDIFSNCEVRRT